MRIPSSRSLYLALLALLAASLWLSRAGVSLALAGLALHALLAGDWRHRTRRLRRQAWVWPCLALFAAYGLGLLHTYDLSEGLDKLIVKLPLLLLPLVIGSYPALTGREFRLLREVYLAAGGIACLLALIGATWQAFQSGEWTYSHFSYAPLAGQIGLHPTLMGMLLNAAALLIVLPGGPWRLSRPFSRRLRWIGLGGIFLMEVLLASRIQFPLALIGAAGTGAIWALQPRRRRYGLPALLLLSFSLVALLSANPRISKRMGELLEWEIEDVPVDELPHHGVAVRTYLWGETWRLIQAAPWAGYGTGDAQAALQGAFAQD
ncbi:MAG: hypothetical protein D6722_02585, partial [Bacteroidetes bacterium]